MTYLVYCVNKLRLCSRTNIIVAEKYKMIKLLGSGAFGEIYKGEYKRALHVGAAENKSVNCLIFLSCVI